MSHHARLVVALAAAAATLLVSVAAPAAAARSNTRPVARASIASRTIIVGEGGWSGPAQASDAANGWADQVWRIVVRRPRGIGISVADCCIVGDNFAIYLDGSLVGTTPEQPLDGAVPSTGSVQVNVKAGIHYVRIQDVGAIRYAAAGASFMIPAGFDVRIVVSKPQPEDRLLLPFPVGQTWTVCQGYNGAISHRNTYALDLSIQPGSAGPRGCGIGQSASDGLQVTSPGTGTVVGLWKYDATADDATADLVCIDLDVGGSVLVGHVASVRSDGTPLSLQSRVAAGEQVGTLLPLAQSSRSHYAHIHIEAFAAKGCAKTSRTPFVGRYGFGCVEPMPSDGTVGQYRGWTLTRC
jgi:hypothetical protein